MKLSAVGSYLALKERPELAQQEVAVADWLNSRAFGRVTGSDGANVIGKLRDGLFAFVRDEIAWRVGMDQLTQIFEGALQEIEAYLDLLEALERQVREGPPRIGGAAITTQQQKILYSSVYLQLCDLSRGDCHLVRGCRCCCRR